MLKYIEKFVIWRYKLYGVDINHLQLPIILWTSGLLLLIFSTRYGNFVLQHVKLVHIYNLLKFLNFFHKRIILIICTEQLCFEHCSPAHVNCFNHRTLMYCTFWCLYTFCTCTGCGIKKQTPKKTYISRERYNLNYSNLQILLPYIA